MTKKDMKFRLASRIVDMEILEDTALQAVKLEYERVMGEFPHAVSLNTMVARVLGKLLGRGCYEFEIERMAADYRNFRDTRAELEQVFEEFFGQRSCDYRAGC